MTKVGKLTRRFPLRERVWPRNSHREGTCTSRRAVHVLASDSSSSDCGGKLSHSLMASCPSSAERLQNSVEAVSCLLLRNRAAALWKAADTVLRVSAYRITAALPKGKSFFDESPRYAIERARERRLYDFWGEVGSILPFLVLDNTSFTSTNNESKVPSSRLSRRPFVYRKVYIFINTGTASYSFTYGITLIARPKDLRAK